MASPAGPLRGVMKAAMDGSGPEKFKISLFGRFSLEGPEGSVHLPSKKLAGLLGFLVCARGVPASRAKLTNLLWGSHFPAQAQQNLRQALFRLRRLLGANIFVGDDEKIAVAAGIFSSDVARFESILREGSPRAFEDAVGLYSDRFLADLSIPEIAWTQWCNQERRRLEGMAVGAIVKLAEYQLDKGDFDSALATAKRGESIDNFRQDVHRLIIRTLAATGRRGEARRQYQQLAALLARELSAEPDASTKSLMESLRLTTRDSISVRDAPDNLPHALSSFVGRTKEISEIIRFVGGNRLVTLCGVGGVGKTRLAIRAAAELRDRFAHGAWLADLTGLSDPSLLPQALARILGVLEQRDRPLMATLCEHLSSRELLVVLDNCEHLTEACQQLVEILLRSAASVRVLATSRETLGVAGEVTFHVPPLSVPQSEMSAETLVAYEAPSLFIERAACVQPGFRITDTNAPEVARLCTWLDGLPLAIELAAARLNVLSLKEICSRLENRLELLTGRTRSKESRHQTLRAAIDWSYELLSGAERKLFRRLSVFAGGWTLEAAETICSGNDLDPKNIFALMTRLIEKSVVVAQTQSEETRYSILMTLREYAHERLVESDEVENVRSRHLEYFTDFAERAQPLLRGHDVRDWRDRLERESDNIRAALQWALRANQAVKGVRLAGALEDFWRMGGHLTEGRQWLDAVLSAAPADRSSARAYAFFGAGRLAWGQGEFARATELTENALGIFRDLGNKWGTARSMMEIGLHAMARNEIDRAASLAHESLSLSREIGDDYALGYSLILEAIVNERTGDQRTAEELFEECLAVRQRIGHKFGIVNALRCLGNIALRQQRYAAAERYYKESIAIAWDAREMYLLPSGLEALGAVAVGTGSRDRAARLFAAAKRFRNLLGVPPIAWEKSIVDDGCRVLAAMVAPNKLQSLAEQGSALTFEQAVCEALADC
jgi:predicted ATPase/DNA-binding SARP family transcriptional activator